MDTLKLETDNLFSKWGFWDGSLPDEVLHAIDDPRGVVPIWDQALRLLVVERMLPLIDEDISFYTMDSHNPIRIETLNGEEIPDEVIYNARVEHPHLSLEYVEVPMDDVVELCYELRGEAA